MFWKMSLVATAMLLCSICSVAFAYTTHEVRQWMTGLWVLKGATQPSEWKAPRYPMKEFTVYPKQKMMQQQQDSLFYLMLQEDGTFYVGRKQDQVKKLYEKQQERLRQQNQALEQQGRSSSKQMPPRSVALFQTQAQKDQELDRQTPQVPGLDWKRGQWEYVDGKLLLAADRPKNKQAAGETTSSLSSLDMLLEGKVEIAETNFQEENMKVHLSVPLGSVKLGKFMYPKTHPSFFDNPMVKATPACAIQLQQVLTKTVERPKALVFTDKFRREDLAGKRFMLITKPLPIHDNDPVYKTPYAERMTEDEKVEEDIEETQAMEVLLHRNYTFEWKVRKGISKGTILRGHWDITGELRDQFWMKVSRFGFGRSVSGSTFSEGKFLSHEHVKTYIGKIGHKQEDGKNYLGPIGSSVNKGETDPRNTPWLGFRLMDNREKEENNDEKSPDLLLEIKGTTHVGDVQRWKDGTFQMTELQEGIHVDWPFWEEKLPTTEEEEETTSPLVQMVPADWSSQAFQ